MNVFIESTLNGVSTCHLELATRPSDTVDSLISAFCIEKGIRQRPQYVLKTKQDVLLDSSKSLESYGIMSGDVLYLTTSNGEQHLFGFHNWWLLSAVALVIGLVGLVIVFLVYYINNEVPFVYGIVFDAGSTHTTMVIYKWDGEKDNGTGEVSQVYLCTVNGTGISSYVKDPEMAGKSLENCLSQAKGEIPNGKRETSHLYLGATAGMRILKLSQPEVAQKIMASVNETLALSGFDFVSGQSRIITGQEEGVFGWISVNYLSQRLETNSLQTIGALDMGGASTQISFVPNSRVINESCCTMDLRLYGYNYHVYSRSFLCFGMSEFLRRYHSLLASEQSMYIPDPCIQTGFTYNISKNQIFDQLCTVEAPTSAKYITNFHFYGDYNSTECEALIKDLLNLDHCSHRYKYCLNSTTVPDIHGDFMAFSGFSYIMDDLNITHNSSLAQVKDKVEEFCNRTSDEVIHVNVPKTGNNSLQQLCFKSKYILVLLTSIYKFNDTNWNRISFLNSVRKVDLGWSLGFMTNATNIIPEEQRVETLALPTFIILTIVFAIFILTAIVFGYYAWKQKSRPSTYQRFSQYGAI